jgi:hypothetical protein
MCAWTDGVGPSAGHNTFRVCGRRRTHTFVTYGDRPDRRLSEAADSASRSNLPMIPATVPNPTASTGITMRSARSAVPRALRSAPRCPG